MRKVISVNKSRFYIYNVTEDDIQIAKAKLNELKTAVSASKISGNDPLFYLKHVRKNSHLKDHILKVGSENIDEINKLLDYFKKGSIVFQSVFDATILHGVFEDQDAKDYLYYAYLVDKIDQATFNYGMQLIDLAQLSKSFHCNSIYYQADENGDLKTVSTKQTIPATQGFLTHSHFKHEHLPPWLNIRLEFSFIQPSPEKGAVKAHTKNGTLILQHFYTLLEQIQSTFPSHISRTKDLWRISTMPELSFSVTKEQLNPALSLGQLSAQRLGSYIKNTGFRVVSTFHRLVKSNPLWAHNIAMPAFAMQIHDLYHIQKNNEIPKTLRAKFIQLTQFIDKKYKKTVPLQLAPTIKFLVESLYELTFKNIQKDHLKALSGQEISYESASKILLFYIKGALKTYLDEQFNLKTVTDFMAYTLSAGAKELSKDADKRLEKKIKQLTHYEFDVYKFDDIHYNFATF